jgi:dTMP kinase
MFVTFEGIEGTGKSTQIERLAAHLRARGRRTVLLTREPGGSGIGRELRSVLLRLESRNLSPLAELFLYLADRAQHVAEVVRPAIERGAIVISDRFTDSTVAFQGFGRGLDLGLIERLNAAAVAGVVPDLTVLLDLDPKIGLARARARNAASGTAAAEGRFEAEDLAFHARVRKGYLELARKEPGRIAVVDAGQSPDAVFEAVRNLADERLRF